MKIALHWLITLAWLSIATGPVDVSAQFEVLSESWPSPISCDTIGDPVRIEPLDEVTFVLRESPCVDREAPFLFLLIGTEQAILVDSGTQDSVFLAEVVGQKLAGSGLGFADLTVVHTHSHLDHRGGDRTFTDAGAIVVGSTLEEVREFWNLEAWPEDVASLDLGNRLIEVLPIPGHNDNSIALFDHNTQILLSGDSMMRGRINITDLTAFRKSVVRLSRFIKGVHARAILGGHMERENVPLGLDPATTGELIELSERVGLLHPLAFGKHFTVVYLWPLLATVGIGFLLLLGGLLWFMRTR